MIGRVVALVALAIVCTATSCFTQTMIAVTPRRTTPDDSVADSAAQVAFAVTAGLAARHQLREDTSAYRRDAGWTRCYATPERSSRERFFIAHLCERVAGRGLQFLLIQNGKGFTPLTDSLRHELIDSLRVRFGEGAVRECPQVDVRGDPPPGCLPPTGGRGNGG
jgi:hypothetical protein